MSGEHEVDAAVAAALDELDWDGVAGEGGPIDPHRLAASIRRRRQRLVVGAAAAGTVAVALAAVVVVTTLTSARGGGPGGPAAGGASSALPAGTPSAGTSPAGGAAGCGASEDGLLAGTTAALTAGAGTADAGTADASGPGIVPFPVTLTNPGPGALRGTAGLPRLVLVAGGRVVAVSTGERAIGIHVDLAAGGTQQLQGSLSLLDCTRSTPSAAPSGKVPTGPPPASLQPGRYGVYAFVDLMGADGATRVLSGGPWPLTLR